ncbi:MAG TPA: SAM-dependent methyltransferase [Caulobacteraceae bacterium]
MTLMDRLKAQIRLEGPMTIAQYMTACLHDPQAGYYAVRPRLGAEGDFITAPLVSQMFGELIGLWCAETWSRMGRPSRVILAEVGPGDGALIGDALRALRLAPEFLAAAELWLVEPSAPLATRQTEALAGAPLAPRWTGALTKLPADAPLILIANEVLDCLPARQFVRTPEGWAERLVGLDEAGALAFGLARRSLDRALPEAEPGSVLEIAAAQEAFAAEIGRRVSSQGGAALLIDYGRTAPGFGDTFQALKGHQKRSPLETPGEADLTVHADFPAVLSAARAEGAEVAILTQRELLLRLGVVQRAEALALAQPDRAGQIGRQLDRLIGEDQMGGRFKAACIHAPGLVPPGFEAV